MRYYGGKGIHGKKISQILINYVKLKGFDISNITYLEPFCGALGVFRHIAPLVKKSYANDNSKDLIMLWKMVSTNKFKNPNIDHQRWTYLKHQTKSSAERAFAGFGCSFGGTWFNGYIPNSNDSTYNTLNRISDNIKNSKFSCLDYVDFLKKVIDTKETYLIYLDPPYKNTCNNPYINYSFNHDQFWKIVKLLSREKNILVVVSELNAPPKVIELSSFKRRSGMHNTSSMVTYTEKLYVMK